MSAPTPDLAELRDRIAGAIHRRICEHSREDCIENLGRCERATDSAMPLVSTALDEGDALARLLAGALNDAIRTLRELAEKAAGEPIPFDDFDFYAEVVDGALNAAAERDALAAKVERVRALHRPAYNDVARSPMCEDCGGKAGVHPCGCWAEDDYEFVCAVCNQGTKNQSVPWPCPTVRALDEEPQP